MKVLRILLAVGLACGLAACGSTSARKPAPADRPSRVATAPATSPTAPLQGYSRYKVGRPYTIKGKRYVPEQRLEHTETGQASWYGPGFHGKKTANGEPFDKYAMTAAHRTLQLPSIVKVTNIGNGRVAVLRVNDRGPYHGGRILDVSEAAAEALGFKHLGVAKVRVEVMRAESERAAILAKNGASVSELEDLRQMAERFAGGRSAATELAAVGQAVGRAGPPADQAYIQAGAFSDLGNAGRMAARLGDIADTDVRRGSDGEKSVFRVWLGPFDSIREAESVLPSVLARGATGAHVIVVK